MKIILCSICKRSLKSRQARALKMGRTCAKKNPAQADEARGQRTLFGKKILNREKNK